LIVGEIGLNHLGNAALATRYIDMACDTSIDAVTFQIREAAFYSNPKHQHLRLPETVYRSAAKRLRAHGKRLGFAIGSASEVEFVTKFEPEFLKVLSWGIKDGELINRLLESNIELLFFSTGMSDFTEIDNFLYSFADAKEKVRLIHTQLTSDIEQVNLSVIPMMEERYGLPIAYGHHCAQVESIYLSLAYRPSDIFFYIKSSSDHAYPDDEFAVPVSSMDDVIRKLKILPKAIGEEVKIEMPNKIELARRNAEFS
jgi:sialic acid synthase SpsE